VSPFPLVESEAWHLATVPEQQIVIFIENEEKDKAAYFSSTSDL